MTEALPGRERYGPFFEREERGWREHTAARCETAIRTSEAAI